MKESKILNIIRYYNRNRKVIWIGIFIILFVLFIINLLNTYYENEKVGDNSSSTSQQLNQTRNYQNESQAMVSGGISSEKKQEKFGDLLEQFLSSCVNGQIEEAYDLLSSECRQKLYPTIDDFRVHYISSIFDGDKDYEFQLWSGVDQTYIYLVKIFNDMLSTGIASQQNYIQDYISVVEEDNQYRLNVSSLVKSETYKKTEEKDSIAIELTGYDEYMDYSIAHFSITNNTNQDILMSDISNDDNIYVEDDQGIEFHSTFLELTEEDLIVEKNTTKEMDIEFIRSYSTQAQARRIGFAKIIKDYNVFKENEEEYEDTVEIKINL